MRHNITSHLFSHLMDYNLNIIDFPALTITTTTTVESRNWEDLPADVMKKILLKLGAVEILESAQKRNWDDLPADVTKKILLKLGAVEILESAQKVCSSWWRICKDPSMWRHIDMRNSGDTRGMSYRDMEYYMEKMCRHAVDRSEGGLIYINIERFCTVKLLHYIAERASGLKRLRLCGCGFHGRSDLGLILDAPKFPLLEDLELALCQFSVGALEAIGKSYPSLRCFKYKNTVSLYKFDDEAQAIAESMPGLRELEFVGKDLTDIGFQAILKGCPQLESLDLVQAPQETPLQQMANLTSGLKRLRLVSCYKISDEALTEAALKFPLLEELELSSCLISGKALEAVGKSCPLLRCFKFNNNCRRLIYDYCVCDDEARAIAENMSGLRELQLVKSNLTDDGLQAILQGCPQLESLELRQCSRLGNVKEMCVQVKYLKLPDDSPVEVFDSDIESFADDGDGDGDDYDDYLLEYDIYYDDYR